MRLGIVTDCVHFKNSDGKVGTETHILLKQLESLAVYFKTVTICCPFTEYDKDVVASYYSLNNIEFVPVPNVGGNSFFEKLTLLKTIPKWWRAFKKMDRITDLVYQRFPNNLNIPGFFYFYFKKKKVFATYTGTWNNYKREPVTYRFQKKMLQKYFRGPVWAYLEHDSPNDRIHKGFSPSYHQSVWDEESEFVNKRLEKLYHPSPKDLKLISVGTFNKNKNQQLILDACLILKKKDIPFTLTLVGDGPLKKTYEQFIKANNLETAIFIAGKKTAEELRLLYRKNDFVVQAPIREGFRKVPIEGFFHGLVPVLSNVSLAKSITLNGQRGFVFKSDSVTDLVTICTEIYQNKYSLSNVILAGREFAKSQTLESWALEYVNTVQQFYR